ncbi:ATP-dependent RNA helicase DDX1-like [Dendronephthya gigantea]|uniref:ATP-dependent RNA helicase DDX1-like n=1 Tax=Dendronephthya gigantea TaxID=151771 RepID=UPI00106BAB39|nr:ATP-dependent RNA helicase DDX1-like [Dendronephthya gigantea]
MKVLKFDTGNTQRSTTRYKMAGHFSEFGILPEILQAIEEMGWHLPTDVQAEAIPLILGGGDVLMAAETGSGKTGAFCLPVIQVVYETIQDALSGKKSGKVLIEDKEKTWKMNVYDRDSLFAIDEDGLLCQSRDQSKWQGGRSVLAVKKGKFYYEAKVTDEGLCRVGWSTKDATFNLGTDRFGFGFGGTGKSSFNKQFDTYGESFGLNDVIGCYINLEDGTVKWSKNGTDFGEAYEIPDKLQGVPFHAAVVLKNAELKFNFGGEPFRYPPKEGYIGLSSARPGCVTSSTTGTVSRSPGKFSNECSPSAIILEPSRELAQQTHSNITLFKKHLPSPSIKEVVLIGGEKVKDQIRLLQEGVDVITGTPGKFDDFVSTKKISLDQVRFFILDEADGLLSQGNHDIIMRIYNKIPKFSSDGKRLQMIVCSATLHSFEVKKLADKIMHFPTWVDLKGRDSVPETVHHVVVHVDPRKDYSWKSLRQKVKTDGVHNKDKLNQSHTSPEMFSEASKMLKAEYLVKAIRQHRMDQAIVFCRTKLDCDNIENYLINLGGGNRAMVNEYSCVCLHSDRSVHERRENLRMFKEGEVRFLICTDVAARGIDVQGIPFVVNVTFPDDKQNYIHRIGRVGRADRMGLAVSLISDVKEKVWYHKCPSRGKSCNNTKLVEHGGCSIWYDELQYLNDVEEHLGVSIPECNSDMVVPQNEFDGKVVYGAKRKKSGSMYENHVLELEPSLAELVKLEKDAQTSFLKLRRKKWTAVH